MFVWERLILLLNRASKDRLNSHGHVRDMDIDEVSLASLLPKLSQCLNEGHTLNIADRTTLVDGKSQTVEQEEISDQIACPSWLVNTYQFDLRESVSKMLLLRCSGTRLTNTHIRFLS